MKINWIAQEQNWAFGNFRNHLKKEMPNYQHFFDDKNNIGDINFSFSPNFFKRGYPADDKTILLIPGFRIFGDIRLKKEREDNMAAKILSAEFTPSWSWGFTFMELEKKTDMEFDRVFYNNGDKINSTGYDMVFAQNVSLLKKFKERLRTVCRMGGNLNFDNAINLEPLLLEMSKCFCLIATNKKLYDIASAIHENVYLIPNGIDLDEWSKFKKPSKRPFTVGFCGNITTPQYREYKGYDLVEKACSNAHVKLKTALYKNNQIPHDRMRELFYGEIDCIVHPTLGEGCSNTLMEASACGVPIITTECAGFHGEMMVNSEDVLFCNRTVNSIQKAVMLLRKNKKLREKLSTGSRVFAVKHHDILKIVKEYESIFEKCVESVTIGTPSIIFYTTIRTPSKTTAVYSVNGEKPTSDTFPPGTTKDQIKNIIEKKYKQRTK